MKGLLERSAANRAANNYSRFLGVSVTTLTSACPDIVNKLDISEAGFFFPSLVRSIFQIPYFLSLFFLVSCLGAGLLHPLETTQHTSNSIMVLIDKHEYVSQEERRLREDREHSRYWKRWGPYVAERQWATGMLLS